MPYEARKEYIKEDAVHPEHTTPGVGADIYIRKKMPGAHIGKGYTIDIYENGVKQDSLEVSNKNEVTDLIRLFKEKYRTDRAFQNEIQVHITYKTKEERGEKPEKVPKIDKVPETSLEKEAPVIPEKKPVPITPGTEKVKEERAMASVDNILYKQANQIQGLLQRLLNPELPVKVRKAQEVPDVDPILKSVSSVPETPIAGGVDDKSEIKKFIADEIIKKYTTFVADRVNKGVEELDEFYNPLKKWYGKLGVKIEEWNKMSEGAFTLEDIKDIVKQTEKIILSQDSNIITEATGIQVDQKIADLMYEIGSKSVGKKGDAEEGGDLGGDPETSQKKMETMATIKKFLIKQAEQEEEVQSMEDKVAELTRQIQTVGSTTPIEEIARVLDLKETTTLMSMYNILNKKSALNESETAAKKWIGQELSNKEKDKQFVEGEVKSFWKYAGLLEGTHDIESIFIDWLSTKRFGLDEVHDVWDKISNDVVEIFEIREAAIIPEAIMNATESILKFFIENILEIEVNELLKGKDLTAFDAQEEILKGEIIKILKQIAIDAIRDEISRGRTFAEAQGFMNSTDGLAQFVENFERQLKYHLKMKREADPETAVIYGQLETSYRGRIKDLFSSLGFKWSDFIKEAIVYIQEEIGIKEQQQEG